jgi:protein-disulfide isomerase
MVNFWKRNRGFIIGVIATCALIIGGIMLFSGNSDNSKTSVQNSSILISDHSYITSGVINGEYLPASPSATVTLVEFGDYVCPACAAYEPYVKQILTDLPGKVNFVFRNYPLSYHTNAPLASYAVEAAGIQGKYWQMHEKVFTTKDTWSNLSDPTNTFVGFATDLGLNIDKFKSDISSQTVKDIVSQDRSDGDKTGLSETPTFYLNGVKVNLTGNFSDLENIVKRSLSSGN